MEQVLIIDDDDSIVDTIDKVLSRLGFVVKVARDGKEGIDYLENAPNSFKLIVTDIRMPSINGNQVAKYIRGQDQWKDIPIVAITGFPEDVDSRLFNSILTKPFKIRELIDSLT